MRERRRDMNSRHRAITVRIIPSSRNPLKLNWSPIMIPMSREERIVPKYLEVLNKPEVTPMISFGEWLNKAACMATLFSPLLIPKAARARMMLITGDAGFSITIHSDPMVMRIAEPACAGRGPEALIHLPAIGETASEHRPRLNIRSPVWNSLTLRTSLQIRWKTEEDGIK